jgi:hypothetical protein
LLCVFVMFALSACIAPIVVFIFVFFSFLKN